MSIGLQNHFKLCATWNGPPEQKIIEIHCATVLPGDSVTIKNPGSHKEITVCEVEVYAIQTGML